MVDSSDTSQPDRVIEALLVHDVNEAAWLLSQHLLDRMSYFNYDEDFYHGFIGAYLKRGGYMVELDKKYGLGQCVREKYIESARTKFQDAVCYGLACHRKECMMQEVTENDRWLLQSQCHVQLPSFQL